MLIIPLLVVAALVVVLVIVIASRPSSFRVARSAVIPASSTTVFAEVNDLHRWKAWSPWARLDPHAKTTYDGPVAGPGAIMAWDGNNEIGAGRMTLLRNQPNESIDFQLDFLRPFKGTNFAQFTFEPADGGTLITWSMTGKCNFIAKAVSLFMNCDKMVGGQFEKGLANLASVTGQTVNA